MELNAKDEAGTNIPYTTVITFDETGSCNLTSANPTIIRLVEPAEFGREGIRIVGANEDQSVLYLNLVELPSSLVTRSTRL